MLESDLATTRSEVGGVHPLNAVALRKHPLEALEYHLNSGDGLLLINTLPDREYILRRQRDKFQRSCCAPDSSCLMSYRHEGPSGDGEEGVVRE